MAPARRPCANGHDGLTLDVDSSVSVAVSDRLVMVDENWLVSDTEELMSDADQSTASVRQACTSGPPVALK